MRAFASLGHRAIFQEYGRNSGGTYYQDQVHITEAEANLDPTDDFTVLWVTHAPHYRLKETYRADFLVFDYIDEATDEFAVWNNSDLYEAMQKADLITVVSRRLLQIVTKLYPEKPVLLLPNAAELDHFGKSKLLSIPDDMQAINPPIIGFMGSIAQWLDVNLLQEMAELRPEWSFVMVGPDYIGLESELRTIQNIYFLGRKSYQELPRYVGHFSIGMIPFTVKDMTHSSSPIKMYEYLAAGIPVISTAIREAVQCPFVETALSASEWMKKIEQLLEAPYMEEEIALFLRQHSWENRAKTAVQTISRLIVEEKVSDSREEANAINSKAYWNNRFQTDWELLHGKKQTRFFAQITIQNLPPALLQDIRLHRYTIADIGCAEGDGLELLSYAFQNNRLTGIDLSPIAIEKASMQYPRIQFLERDIFQLDEEVMFDVVYTSNILEHFTDPHKVMEEMAKHTRQVLIMLVPFQEHPLSKEHVYRFDYEDFPYAINHFHLDTLQVIDCSKMDYTYWCGKQMLAVYR